MLDRLGDDPRIRILRLGAGENRIDRSVVDALHAALDEVAATPGPAALVTVGGDRFFSNGIDLDWALAEGRDDRRFVPDFERLLGRLLTIDVITVAAVTGHAFAGGAMLAAVHDVRIMRRDRGYWCLPEVTLGRPLRPAMHAVLAARIPHPALSRAELLAERFGGPDALAAGIVDEVAEAPDVEARAIAVARAHVDRDRRTVGAHKSLLYGEAAARAGQLVQ